MRLQTFTATNMSEAMALVRADLGKDAIIVSTQHDETDIGGSRVRVTAALETEGAATAAYEELAGIDTEDALDTIREWLIYHRTPPRLAEKLLNTVRSQEIDDPVMAFAGALDDAFVFAPLRQQRSARPLMLIGPPGSGKTVTAAKLAARAVVAGHTASLITTDIVRAGAMEQLAAYAKLLELEVKVADRPRILGRTVAALPEGGFSVIDTPGINPLNINDLNEITPFLRAADTEPILVLAAGGDAYETVETAEAFAALGVSRFVITRIDSCRRFGGLLAAADAARLTFGDVTSGPHIGDGLHPIDPVSLALLLTGQPSGPLPTLFATEAMS